MSTIICPACKKEHDDCDFPDLLLDLGPSNRTEFECDCGVAFEVHVDFEAVYYELENTVRRIDGK
jgi:hypothetical protein